jgi:hypothetical protein
MCQKAVCYAAGTLTLSHKSLLNAEGALIGSKEVILAPNDTPPQKDIKKDINGNAINDAEMNSLKRSMKLTNC